MPGPVQRPRGCFRSDLAQAFALSFALAFALVSFSFAIAGMDFFYHVLAAAFADAIRDLEEEMGVASTATTPLLPPSSHTSTATTLQPATHSQPPQPATPASHPAATVENAEEDIRLFGLPTKTIEWLQTGVCRRCFDMHTKPRVSRGHRKRAALRLHCQAFPDFDVNRGPPQNNTNKKPAPPHHHTTSNSRQSKSYLPAQG